MLTLEEKDNLLDILASIIYLDSSTKLIRTSVHGDSEVASTPEENELLTRLFLEGQS